MLDDEKGLLLLAQMNVLEIHAWCAHADDVAERIDEYPAPGKDVGAANAFRDWKPS